MNPVSASELLQIQQDVAVAACDKPAVIQRKATTKDAYGSEKEVQPWPIISPPDQMAGMTEPTGGQLANYSYIIGNLAAWRLQFPIGTNVKLQDHVTIEGQTMTVQVDLTPRSYPALLTVLATEIQR